tara:strand:+ start:618 stop:842 length:225 start_codon:yes stop_codon:yes gene_type:complete
MSSICSEAWYFGSAREVMVISTQGPTPVEPISWPVCRVRVRVRVRARFSVRFRVRVRVKVRVHVHVRFIKAVKF